MKIRSLSRILVLLFIGQLVCSLVFSQENDEFSDVNVKNEKIILKEYFSIPLEYSIGLSCISTNSKMNEYLKDIYSDYESKSITTFCLGINGGYAYMDGKKKITVTADYFGNIGKRSIKDKDKHKTQYTLFFSNSIAGCVGAGIGMSKGEYYLILKTGFGVDFTNYFYSRKYPYESYLYSYHNLFVPVSLGFDLNMNKIAENMSNKIKDGNKNVKVNIKNNYGVLGIFVQSNIFVKNIKVKNTGLSGSISGVPAVSQNILTIGIKYTR